MSRFKRTTSSGSYCAFMLASLAWISRPMPAKTRSWPVPPMKSNELGERGKCANNTVSRPRRQAHASPFAPMGANLTIIKRNRVETPSRSRAEDYPQFCGSHCATKTNLSTQRHGENLKISPQRRRGRRVTQNSLAFPLCLCVSVLRGLAFRFTLRPPRPLGKTLIHFQSRPRENCG